MSRDVGAIFIRFNRLPGGGDEQAQFIEVENVQGEGLGPEETLADWQGRDSGNSATLGPFSPYTPEDVWEARLNSTHAVGEACEAQAAASHLRKLSADAWLNNNEKTAMLLKNIAAYFDDREKKGRERQQVAQVQEREACHHPWYMNATPHVVESKMVCRVCGEEA